jgi:hypothetical protein
MSPESRITAQTPLMSMRHLTIILSVWCCAVAHGAELDVAHHLREAGVDPRLDEHGRARIVALHGDVLAAETDSGGTCELRLEPDGELAAIACFDAGDLSSSRSSNLIRSQIERFVSDVLPSGHGGRASVTRPEEALAALLGPACPTALCGDGGPSARSLQHAVQLLPAARPPSPGFGDLLVDGSRDALLVYLGRGYLLEVSPNAPPALVYEDVSGLPSNERPWLRPLSGPARHGIEATEAQVRRLGAEIARGRPQPLSTPRRFEQRRLPRPAAFLVRLDARMVGDAHARGQGFLGLLDLGVPFQIADLVEVTPRLLGGVASRPLPEPVAGEVPDRLGSLGLGADLTAPFPIRARFFLQARLSPSVRVDGLAPTRGEISRWCVDLPVALELRWPAFAVGLVGGVEFSHLTAGRERTASGMWERFVSGTLGVNLTVLPLRGKKP